MKLVLDQTACQGYGMCQDAAPDLLDLDDWGYAGLLGDGTVTRDLQGQAREAAAVCPVAALKVL
jgi:ferredoxin